MERKKRLEKVSIGDYLFNILNKNIDLKYFIFNFKSIEEYCLKAGMRQERKHKIYGIMQYISAIFFSLIGIYITKLWLGKIEFSYATVGFIGFGILGFFFPTFQLSSLGKERQQEFSFHFPDVLDLLYICVEAGMTIDRAFLRITEEYKEVSSVVHDEFSQLSAELTYFNDIIVAYNNFKKRMPIQSINTFNTTIIQAIKFGSPLAVALKVISEEERAEQSARIERKAAALPTKLTIPMMLFSLPVLFVIILFPVIYSAMQKF